MEIHQGLLEPEVLFGLNPAQGMGAYFPLWPALVILFVDWVEVGLIDGYSLLQVDQALQTDEKLFERKVDVV